MAIVGESGNNASEFIEGVPARLYFGLVARAYTYSGREMDNPTFGLGIVDGLSNQQLPTVVWENRVRDSFAGLEGADLNDLQVRVVDGRIELVLDIDHVAS